MNAKKDELDAKVAENDAESAEADASTPSTSRQLRSRRLSTRCLMPCWREGRPTSWLLLYDLGLYAELTGGDPQDQEREPEAGLLTMTSA